MNVNQLDTKKTGLLFFDLLNVYYHGAPEETQKRMKPVVDNAVRLMDAARKASIPVFYAMANHRKDGQIRSMIVTDTDMRLRPWPNDDCSPTVHGATEGSWEQKVIDEIAPRPEDTIIPKYRWSTFHQTYFDLALRSRGIDTIIISGGAVDVGVASTVYAARDLDYDVIVVRDACSNSHEDSMAAFMNTVFPRMARVRSTDQVLEMIRKG
ncbi:MAG TPA: cysteine hydrolase [Candidatus Binatia bacterium]|jgi:nicotinamidase-related amidase|nr:cysteine hydrolase [Candidatus Binatia bacterium]